MRARQACRCSLLSAGRRAPPRPAAVDDKPRPGGGRVAGGAVVYGQTPWRRAIRRSSGKPRASVSDLRSGVAMSGGSGEQALLTAGCAQMHRFSGLPGRGSGRIADAKVPTCRPVGRQGDLQTTMAGLSGLNMVYEGIGWHCLRWSASCMESLVLRRRSARTGAQMRARVDVTEYNVRPRTPTCGKSVSRDPGQLSRSSTDAERQCRTNISIRAVGGPDQPEGNEPEIGKAGTGAEERLRGENRILEQSTRAANRSRHGTQRSERPSKHLRVRIDGMAANGPILGRFYIQRRMGRPYGQRVAHG